MSLLFVSRCTDFCLSSDCSHLFFWISDCCRAWAQDLLEIKGVLTWVIWVTRSSVFQRAWESRKIVRCERPVIYHTQSIVPVMWEDLVGIKIFYRSITRSLILTGMLDKLELASLRTRCDADQHDINFDQTVGRRADGCRLSQSSARMENWEVAPTMTWSSRRPLLNFLVVKLPLI